MAKNITGKTSATKQNLMLNAGAWFRDFVVGTDTYESAKTSGKCIGATQDGGSFVAAPEVREIPIDGADAIPVYDAWTVTMQANMLEFTPENIALALGTGVIEDAPGTASDQYYMIRARRQINTDTDFIGNITWVGTLSGTDTPVIIQVFNTINTAGINIAMAPKSNGILAVTFTSSTKMDEEEGDEEYAPFAIYYPKDVMEED